MSTYKIYFYNGDACVKSNTINLDSNKMGITTLAELIEKCDSMMALPAWAGQVTDYKVWDTKTVGTLTDVASSIVHASA